MSLWLIHSQHPPTPIPNFMKTKQELKILLGEVSLSSNLSFCQKNTAPDVL